jgi:excisionase family DNA binding protein
MSTGLKEAAEEAVAQVERATLTVDEAAKFLGVSRWAAYEVVKNKEIPAVKIGRRLLVPRALLEQKLANA